MTLSRRRLALIGVAAVAALVLGFVAAKVFAPGRSQPASVAAPSRPAPATTTPAAAGPPAVAAAAAPAPDAAKPAAAPSAPAPAPAGGGAPATAAPQHLPPTSLPTVSLSDRRAGFRLSYPRSWSRLRSTDPTVPVLLSSRDGASLLVRALQLPTPINGRRLAAIRDATGLIIRGKPGVTIIAGPRLLASSNLPGFLYIYSFLDPASHRRVAHSQIALFAGRRMFTLVFQTARAADLSRFAMLFDKITASFHAL